MEVFISSTIHLSIIAFVLYHKLVFYFRLSDTDFPVRLLPSVQDAGSQAGTLQEVWYNINEGTPIGVAMGDLQCSIISRLNPGDAGLLKVVLLFPVLNYKPDKYVIEPQMNFLQFLEDSSPFCGVTDTFA